MSAVRMNTSGPVHTDALDESSLQIVVKNRNLTGSMAYADGRFSLRTGPVVETLGSSILMKEGYYSPHTQ